MSSWQRKLSIADQVTTIWFEVQRTWTHLESIFTSSEDIRRQLPTDAERFDRIDKEFKQMTEELGRTLNVIEATNKDGLASSLDILEKELVLCEKALAEYLETKRLAFPRFYFVSSSDLLDILSNGNQPEVVAKHLTKLFDSMARLKFDDAAALSPRRVSGEPSKKFLKRNRREEIEFSFSKNSSRACTWSIEQLDRSYLNSYFRTLRERTFFTSSFFFLITNDPRIFTFSFLLRFYSEGMYAKDGEYVEFANCEMSCEGAVEAWLNRLQLVMRITMRHYFGEAVITYEEKAREQWLFDYPAQVSLCSTQIWWTTEVNIAFSRLEEGYDNSLKDYLKKQISQLSTLITLLIGELTKQERQKVMTICTIDVHSRDVVAKLVQSKVETSQAFQWQSQLRHRWDEKEKDCFANICDAQFKYSHEYLGNTPRFDGFLSPFDK